MTMTTVMVSSMNSVSISVSMSCGYMSMSCGYMSMSCGYMSMSVNNLPRVMMSMN